MDACSGIIIFSVIIVLIVFAIVCCYRKTENFSPTGWTQNCPNPRQTMLSPRMAYGKPWEQTGWKRFGKNYIAGSYSPGSVFKCKDPKNCSMIQSEGCPKKEDIPTLRENLPIGWGSTITGPYADNNCMSNINGVNKSSGKNPYGKVYPNGKQMYAFCEKGVNNYFSE